MTAVAPAARAADWVENGWPLCFLQFFNELELDDRLELGDRNTPHERPNALKWSRSDAALNDPTNDPMR